MRFADSDDQCIRSFFVYYLLDGGFKDNLATLAGIVFKDNQYNSTTSLLAIVRAQCLVLGFVSIHFRYRRTVEGFGVAMLQPSIHSFEWRMQKPSSPRMNLETMLIIVPPVVTLLLYKSRKYPLSLKVLASDKNSQNPNPRPPRRITSNVKQNLQYLKIVKEYQKKASSSAPKPATSYRKKKVEKSDLADEIESYEDPTTKLYYTNSGLEMATPVLLVDGYNVCGYWPKLKKHFSKGDLETARQKLLDELVGFSAIKGVKVVVVFDATLSGLTSRKETLQNVDVVYTVDACADSWIEREVTMLIADGCPKVWVVSSDTFHQHAAYGAGAYIWNCKVLITEIKDAKKELQELMHDDSMYSVKGKLLEHNLDPEVFSALQNLKQQLKNPEGS